MAFCDAKDAFAGQHTGNARHLARFERTSRGFENIVRKSAKKGTIKKRLVLFGLLAMRHKKPMSSSFFGIQAATNAAVK